MKKIEKVTTDGDKMYFEKYARKDLRCVVNDFFLDATWNDEIYTDEDSSMSWELDDGTFGILNDEGLDGKRPPISRIKSLRVDYGGYCLGFFGMQLVQNEHYGGWEVIEAA